MNLVAGIKGERLSRLLLAKEALKRVVMVVNNALDVDTLGDVRDERA